MRNQLDCRRLLLVYQRVRDLGSRQQYGTEYQGVRAWSDFDGYTLFLSDGCVILTLFFHNHYELEYPDTSALEQFLVRLERLMPLEQGSIP